MTAHSASTTNISHNMVLLCIFLLLFFLSFAAFLKCIHFLIIFFLAFRFISIKDLMNQDLHSHNPARGPVPNFGNNCSDEIFIINLAAGSFSIGFKTITSIQATCIIIIFCFITALKNKIWIRADFKAMQKLICTNNILISAALVMITTLFL